MGLGKKLLAAPSQLLGWMGWCPRPYKGPFEGPFI